MLELGLMPVVTTMAPPSLLQINKPGEERVTVINRTKKVSLFVGVLSGSKIMSRFAY